MELSRSRRNTFRFRLSTSCLGSRTILSRRDVLSQARAVHGVFMDHRVHAQERSSSECAAVRRRFKSPVNGQCPPGFYRDRQLHHVTANDDEDQGQDQGQSRCRRHGRRRQRGERMARVCRHCTVCLPGVGALRPCGRRSDTVCQVLWLLKLFASFEL